MKFEIWETADGDAGLVPENHTQKDLAFGVDRKHVESFEALSWAAAMQHYNDRYNFGKYKPLCPESTHPYNGEKLTGDEILRLYPVSLQWMEDGEDSYWLAWLPDFGHSACSQTGETPGEAVEELGKVAEGVLAYYIEKGLEVPVARRDPRV